MKYKKGKFQGHSLRRSMLVVVISSGHALFFFFPIIKQHEESTKLATGKFGFQTQLCP